MHKNNNNQKKLIRKSSLDERLKRRSTFNTNLSNSNTNPNSNPNLNTNNNLNKSLSNSLTGKKLFLFKASNFELIDDGGGGIRRPPLQFLGEDSQIKLYLNLNLHHDLVNY